MMDNRKVKVFQSGNASSKAWTHPVYKEELKQAFRVVNTPGAYTYEMSLAEKAKNAKALACDSIGAVRIVVESGTQYLLFNTEEEAAQWIITNT